MFSRQATAIDLAVAHALRGPAGGGRLAVLGGAVDGRAKDDLLLGALGQLGEDAAGGVPLVEELDAGGDRRVALGIEVVSVFRHGNDTARVNRG